MELNKMLRMNHFMHQDAFTRRKSSLLLLALACLCLLDSCSSTRVGNPKTPAPQLASIEISGNSNSEISRLDLCIQSVTLYPADDSAAQEISIGLKTALAVTSEPQVLMTASVAAGEYKKAEANLNAVCGKSIVLKNRQVETDLSIPITLEFDGVFEISDGSQKITLNLQPIADALAQVNATTSTPEPSPTSTDGGSTPSPSPSPSFSSPLPSVTPTSGGTGSPSPSPTSTSTITMWSVLTGTKGVIQVGQ